MQAGSLAACVLGIRFCFKQDVNQMLGSLQTPLSKATSLHQNALGIRFHSIFYSSSVRSIAEYECFADNGSCMISSRKAASYKHWSKQDFSDGTADVQQTFSSQEPALQSKCLLANCWIAGDFQLIKGANFDTVAWAAVAHSPKNQHFSDSGKAKNSSRSLQPPCLSCQSGRRKLTQVGCKWMWHLKKQLDSVRFLSVFAQIRADARDGKVRPFPRSHGQHLQRSHTFPVSLLFSSCMGRVANL